MFVLGGCGWVVGMCLSPLCGAAACPLPKSLTYTHSSSYVGEQWKKLGATDRAKYEALAEEDRRRYHRLVGGCSAVQLCVCVVGGLD